MVEDGPIVVDNGCVDVVEADKEDDRDEESFVEQESVEEELPNV